MNNLPTHFLIHHQQLSRPLQPCVSSFSMHYLNTLALFPALQPSSLTRSQPIIHYFCDHCNHACLTFTCILQIIRVVSGLATPYTNPALPTYTNLPICVPRSTPTTTTSPYTGRPYQCFFSSCPATLNCRCGSPVVSCRVGHDMIVLNAVKRATIAQAFRLGRCVIKFRFLLSSFPRFARLPTGLCGPKHGLLSAGLIPPYSSGVLTIPCV